jgi:hypothetical protein
LILDQFVAIALKVIGVEMAYFTYGRKIAARR